MPNYKTLGPWPKGMNNLKADYALGPDELRQITNFDVTDEGHLRSRKGKALVYTGSDTIHSLYAAKNGRMYFGEGNALKSMTPDGVVSNVTDAVVSTSGVFFVEPGDGTLFYADGNRSGRLVTPSSRTNWGVPSPPSPPSASGSGGGSGNIYPGQYQFLVTCIDANGEESGTCSIPSSASVPRAKDGNGNLLTGSISVSCGGVNFGEVCTVAGINLYMTETDGDVFYLQTTLSGSGGSYTASDVRPGRILETFGMQQFPPCRYLGWYKGSIVGASGSVVYFSAPLRYGLYDPSRGFMMFDSDIIMLAAMENGIYVSTETETSWVSGDYASGYDRKIVLAYPAAKNSAYSMPDGNAVVWFSQKGFVMGDDDGNAKELHSSTVAVDAVSEATVVVREQDGLRQAIAVPHAKTHASQFSIGDYAEAEVRRANTEV